MSYPQFQAASDYLGAIADEDYVKALPSNSYEDRGGAVLDGPEAGYKVTYTQADAEAVMAEDGSVILVHQTYTPLSFYEDLLFYPLRRHHLHDMPSQSFHLHTS